MSMETGRMEAIDVAVVGGGVTGLAAALAITARGFSACVIERHSRPGLDTSTHNSGVIHGGMYYPAGLAEGAAVCRGPPADCTRFAPPTVCRTPDAAS